MASLRKILCASDLSPASAPAWEHAQFLGGRFGAEVLLLHVAQPLPVPAEGYLPPDLYQQLVAGNQREARDDLEQLVRKAEPPRLRVTTRIETERAAQRVLDIAHDEAVDLVVIGTHGRTGLGRILLGSVADTVVRLASCPVLTVRARGAEVEAAPPGLARICYATDFSPVARRIWPWVLSLAEGTGAHVDVVHVTFEAVPERHLTAETVGAMAQMLREHAEGEAERFLQDCPLPRDRVHVLVGSGVIGDQVVHLARARSADLIAVGTHGWSGLLRWMLGSVAHHVIQTAPCPVLTVGPGGQEGGASS